MQIGDAIERASAVVLVISSLALHSRQVTIEVVRAHESDKPLLPVLVDVTHEQFQARQHEWRAALGAAASVNVPAGGPTAVVPRLVVGLRTLGVRGHATANDARKAIFELLLERPRAVVELAGELPVSRPAVSQHLRVLKDVGLVMDQSSGTRRIYRAHPGGLATLHADLERFWRKTLANYKAVVEQATEENE